MILLPILAVLLGVNIRVSESRKIDNAVDFGDGTGTDGKGPRIFCFRNGLKFQVKTRNPFTGRLYVKGMYNNPQCNRNFNGTVAMPFLDIAYEDCIHTRQKMKRPPGMMISLEIVAQFHPFFTTSVDRAFEVSCSYRESVDTVTTNQMLQWNMLVSHPRGNVGIAAEEGTGVSVDSDTIPVVRLSYEPTLPHCAYTIRKGSPDGPVVSFARVGEMTFHRWECSPSEDGELHGLLVHSCFAKSAEVAVRLLDRRGCSLDPFAMATPAYPPNNATVAHVEVHAFKFADSLEISFSCSISLCLRMNGRCRGITPPNCSAPNERRSLAESRSELPQETHQGGAAVPSQGAQDSGLGSGEAQTRGPRRILPSERSDRAERNDRLLPSERDDQESKSRDASFKLSQQRFPMAVSPSGYTAGPEAGAAMAEGEEYMDELDMEIKDLETDLGMYHFQPPDPEDAQQLAPLAGAHRTGMRIRRWDHVLDTLKAGLTLAGDGGSAGPQGRLHRLPVVFPGGQPRFLPPAQTLPPPTSLDRRDKRLRHRARKVRQLLSQTKDRAAQDLFQLMGFQAGIGSISIAKRSVADVEPEAEPRRPASPRAQPLRMETLVHKAAAAPEDLGQGRIDPPAPQTLPLKGSEVRRRTREASLEVAREDDYETDYDLLSPEFVSGLDVESLNLEPEEQAFLHNLQKAAERERERLSIVATPNEADSEEDLPANRDKTTTSTTNSPTTSTGSSSTPTNIPKAFPTPRRLPSEFFFAAADDPEPQRSTTHAPTETSSKVTTRDQPTTTKATRLHSVSSASLPARDSVADVELRLDAAAFHVYDGESGHNGTGAQLPQHPLPPITRVESRTRHSWASGAVCVSRLVVVQTALLLILVIVLAVCAILVVYARLRTRDPTRDELPVLRGPSAAEATWWRGVCGGEEGRAALSRPSGHGPGLPRTDAFGFPRGLLDNSSTSDGGSMER